MEKKWLTLEETQHYSLELLREFDAICRTHHLQYYLCGGSLLGAVRHKGFIPWDDDIDICMIRPEYEKLLELYLKGKITLSDQRELCSNRNNTLVRHYCKYVRKDIGSTLETFTDEDNSDMGIDIFPIDGAPKSNIALRLQVFLIREVRKLMLTSVQGKKGSVRSKGISTVKNLIRPLLKLIGTYRIARFCERLCKLVDFERTNYVAGFAGMYGVKERWPKKHMLPVRMYAFEDEEFPGYRNYKEYLGNIYGSDYMTPPPKDKQVPHGTTNYWRE